MLNPLYAIGAVLLAFALGGGTGWLVRGDCAK